jgi:excisionase family DNA binding protein
VAEQDKFFSFEEALHELRLKEEELKRLVSEGEIRAFREGETMKLRRTDVEALKSELSGGEVVDLGDVREELVFEDDVDLGDEAGMATQEISDVDTILDDDVEDVGEIELEEEPARETRARPAGPERRTGPARAPAAAAAALVAEEEPEGAGVRFLLIATTLLLLAGLPVALSVSTGRPTSLAQGIAAIFGASFE